MKSLDRLDSNSQESQEDVEMKELCDDVEDEKKKEEDDNQVKIEELFEIEIPVIPEDDVKDEISDDAESTLSPNSKVESPISKSPETAEESKESENVAIEQEPKIKKKTGGIVIRMKKNPKPNGVSESSNDVPEAEVTPTKTEGPVEVIKSEVVDDECSRSSFTNPTKDSSPIRQTEDETLNSISKINENENNSGLNNSKESSNDAQIVAESNPVPVPETQPNTVVNFVKKGEEMSGLCVIM